MDDEAERALAILGGFYRAFILALNMREYTWYLYNRLNFPRTVKVRVVLTDEYQLSVVRGIRIEATDKVFMVGNWQAGKYVSQQLHDLAIAGWNGEATKIYG